jgi:hypothetical protein
MTETDIADEHNMVTLHTVMLAVFVCTFMFIAVSHVFDLKIRHLALFIQTVAVIVMYAICKFFEYRQTGRFEVNAISCFIFAAGTFAAVVAFRRMNAPVVVTACHDN